MKKKLITISALVATVFIVNTAFRAEKTASVCDAPLIGAAHSGAPGEVHCGTSGCHSGLLNSVNGNVLFETSGQDSTYIPGMVYTMNIGIEQVNVDKFGFQIIALKDADNSFVGSYTLTDPTNTRLINGSGGKKYVGSTPCGSDADPVGSLGWSFDWEAPAADEGSITFYLAALATNHNHATSGDDTYTRTLTLQPQGVAGVEDGASPFTDVNVYPNPTADDLNISYVLEQASDVQITLTDLRGKRVMAYNLGVRAAGSHRETISIGNELNSGVYSLGLMSGSGSLTTNLSLVK